MRLSPLFWESVQPLHFPLWLDQRLSLRLGLHLSRTLIFLMHAETTNFTNLTNYFWRRYSLCTQPTDAVRRVQRLCVIHRCCAPRTEAVRDLQMLCVAYRCCTRSTEAVRRVQHLWTRGVLLSIYSTPNHRQPKGGGTTHRSPRLFYCDGQTECPPYLVGMARITSTRRP